MNVLGSYEITDTAKVFGEFKFVSQETKRPANPNSFWDLLMGHPDNPFLPAWLQTVAAGTGGVSMTLDPVGFGGESKTTRETARAVIGLEGEFDNSWTYEVSAVYGRFDQSGTATRRVINDRWFAAIDAVTDPNTGSPACRSSVDTSAPPGKRLSAFLPMILATFRLRRVTDRAFRWISGMVLEDTLRVR